jgi:serine/threonine protein phosphatase 1
VIYAISDIHGESDALQEMLETLPVQPSDLVIFLGDAINRGPDGYGCVEQILAFERCRKVFLQGNHEEAMLIFLEEGSLTALTGMNAQSTLDSYAAAGYALTPGDLSSVPESHLRLYAQAYPWTLPFYITGHYIFTHAGWDLARPLGMQNLAVLRWGKVTGWETPVWTQTVVRGHTPLPRVTFARTRPTIGVDTGCGHGGFLSAVALPSGKVYSTRPASFRPDWYANQNRKEQKKPSE